MNQLVTAGIVLGAAEKIIEAGVDISTGKKDPGQALSALAVGAVLKVGGADELVHDMQLELARAAGRVLIP